jgi:hypothetical protein
MKTLDLRTHPKQQTFIGHAVLIAGEIAVILLFFAFIFIGILIFA